MSTPIIILVAVVVLLYVGRHTYKKIGTRHLNGRSTLTLEEIHKKFFLVRGYEYSQVSELWNEIAQTLGVNPGKMRPSDRFGKEIGRELITNEGMESLTELAQNRSRQLGISRDLSTIRSVDDYVSTFIGGSNHF